MTDGHRPAAPHPLAHCDAEVHTVAAWHADNDSPVLARFVDLVRQAAKD